jgi:AraC-like DNA-binding protein
MHGWLPQVVGTLQAAVGLTLTGDLEEIRRGLDHVVRTVPASRTPDERVALRNLLIEFAWRGARQIHAAAHKHGSAMCTFRGESSVFDFFAHHPGDPRQVFLAWLPWFFSELTRTHPLSTAARIAKLVRAHYQQPLEPDAMARRVQMPMQQLRRAFRTEFGMSNQQYREHMRVLASMEELDRQSWKLEAISRHVGYKSKKNFYRAFRKIAGMTPAHFRQRPSDQRHEIIESTSTVLRDTHRLPNRS